MKLVYRSWQWEVLDVVFGIAMTVAVLTVIDLVVRGLSTLMR